MKRWVVAALATAAAVSGGAVWVAAGLRNELEDARESTRLVDLAKAASDQEADHYAKELRRTQQKLEAAHRNLQRARAELRLLARPDRLVERVADQKFCFIPYDARFRGWVRGPLVADVDGDGSEDRVYTVGRPTLLGRSCRYYLVAETGSGTYSTRVGGRRLWLGPQPGEHFQLFLAPTAAAQVNGTGGSEVLVHLSQGASTRFATLYTLTGGAFTRMRAGGYHHDSFSWLGSVTHGGAFDCVDGFFVDSGWGMVGNGPRFAITRRIYRPSGAALVPVRTERHRVRWDAFERFGEIGGRVLAQCDDYVRAPEFPLATHHGPFVTGSWARRGKD